MKGFLAGCTVERKIIVIVVTYGAKSPNLVWPGSVPPMRTDNINRDHSGLLVFPLSNHSFVRFVWVHNEGFFHFAVVIQSVIQSNGSLDTAVANVVKEPCQTTALTEDIPMGLKVLGINNPSHGIGCSHILAQWFAFQG